MQSHGWLLGPRRVVSVQQLCPSMCGPKETQAPAAVQDAPRPWVGRLVLLSYHVVSGRRVGEGDNTMASILDHTGLSLSLMRQRERVEGSIYLPPHSGGRVGLWRDSCL